MLVARNCQPSSLVQALPESVRVPILPGKTSRSESWQDRSTGRDEAWTAVQLKFATGSEPRHDPVPTEANPALDQLLYLFACQVEWERRADPSAAWEVISAVRGAQPELRAHARSLLERPQPMTPQ